MFVPLGPCHLLARALQARLPWRDSHAHIESRRSAHTLGFMSMAGYADPGSLAGLRDAHRVENTKEPSS